MTRYWSSKGVTDGPPVVAEIVWDHDTGGYEWCIASLLRRAKGGTWEYAALEDAGCSCNYAYENSPEFYDLDWTDSLAVAVYRVGTAIDKMYDLDGPGKIDAKAKLRAAAEAL